MLVLSRKLDESIVLGDDITVRIISIDKGVVKLGIDAPKNVSIVRSELLEDVKDSNIASSKEVIPLCTSNFATGTPTPNLSARLLTVIGSGLGFKVQRINL